MSSELLPHPLPDRVLALALEVCNRRGVLLTDLTGHCRLKSVITARFIWWVRLRYLGYSYPEIGRFTGHDHRSVMAGVRRAPAVCKLCGCTDDDACEGGCGWVSTDTCSACVDG